MNKLDEQLLEKIQQDIEQNDILKQLYKEYSVKDLLEYNEYNISDKISNNSYISEQFRLLYLKESQNYKRVEMLYEELVGKKYDHYKYENEKTLTKTEIEKYYLPKNEKIKKMKNLLYKQELRMNFFESVWKALDKQAWLMKLFLKEQG
jgi:hypothetical protein